MKNLTLAALSICAIAACGGGGSQLLDSSVDAFMLCNPVAQTGCQAGEKCTWIIDIDGTATTNPVGHLGCAPAGTVADQAACQFARAGVNSGVDMCIAGDLCLSGKCKPICDPQVEGNAAGACPTDYACASVDGILESGGNAVAGICEAACDPLTQRLKVGTGSLEACGSVDPAMPDRTCVPGGRTVFSCADNVSEARDREVPLMSTTGELFTNSCAPGFVLGFNESSTTMELRCAGLCAPLEMDATIFMDDARKLDNQGDRAALGKLPEDPVPVAGHATCASSAKGAQIGIDSRFGQDCRFLWSVTRASEVDPNNPYNDTLGLCLAYEEFTFMGTTGLLREKSCAEYLRDAPDTDEFGSAAENGCYKFGRTAPGMTALRKKRRITHFRLAYGDVPLVRHIFE